MRIRQPLVRRIVTAFTLMTFVVSGGFTLGIVAIVHFVEESLVSQHLGEELDNILENDLRRGNQPRLDSRTRLYASHMQGYEIPPYLIGLDEGFTEIVRTEEAYHAFVLDTPQQRFILLQDQGEFEARENALFSALVGGLLLSVLAAWGLGLLMARTIISPLIRLAQQVRHRDQLMAIAPNIAPDYPDDEVGRVAAAFDETLSQLRNSLERERLFTSDVSHELRTPLMVISSSVELLEAEPLDSKKTIQVNRIKRASKEISECVETFLLLARAGSQSEQLTGDITIREAAEEQTERWAPRFAEKGLKFDLVDEESSQELLHSRSLETVMSNLIRNALHYTQNGEVRVVLTKSGFRIEDTGEGVPVSHQENIFKPFVRGEQARGEGLGLGLSLVKRICAYQNWRVRMYSLPSGGSCFEVQLA